MTQSFTATRTLTPDEAALEGAVDHARQMAFREVRETAIHAYGSPDLPQDHGLDEAVSPSDEGGALITVTLTLPE